MFQGRAKGCHGGLIPGESAHFWPPTNLRCYRALAPSSPQDFLLNGCATSMRLCPWKEKLVPRNPCQVRIFMQSFEMPEADLVCPSVSSLSSMPLHFHPSA